MLTECVKKKTKQNKQNKPLACIIDLNDTKYRRNQSDKIVNQRAMASLYLIWFDFSIQFQFWLVDCAIALGSIAAGANNETGRLMNTE